MNTTCDVSCGRPYVWEIHWRDGGISLLCSTCAPPIADERVVLARDGRHDWITEADV